MRSAASVAVTRRSRDSDSLAGSSQRAGGALGTVRGAGVCGHAKTVGSERRNEAPSAPGAASITIPSNTTRQCHQVAPLHLWVRRHPILCRLELQKQLSKLGRGRVCGAGRTGLGAGRRVHEVGDPRSPLRAAASYALERGDDRLVVGRVTPPRSSPNASSGVQAPR